jgi:hypothetical protein
MGDIRTPVVDDPVDVQSALRIGLQEELARDRRFPRIAPFRRVRDVRQHQVEDQSSGRPGFHPGEVTVPGPERQEPAPRRGPFHERSHAHPAAPSLPVGSGVPDGEPLHPRREILRRIDPVHQTDPARRADVDRPLHQQPQRPVEADQPRESNRPAPGRNQPHRQLWKLDPGCALRTGDTRVTRECQFDTGAGPASIDRGHRHHG